jgi:glucosamine kinase
MREIYIGVDGGGTKTKVSVEDALGYELATEISGPGNIRSVAGAWASVNQGIESALKKSGIDLNDKNYKFHVGLGLAGTEIPENKADFLKVPHPYHTLVLDSDAYAACLGVHGNKNGAIIIVGTGVIGFQVESGFRSRVGGWGFPHADEGGGAWLGMEAIRLAFKGLDGRCSITPMLEAILKKFQVIAPGAALGNLNELDAVTFSDPSALVSFSNHAKPGDFGSIAPLVLEYLNQGDPHSKSLIERAAEEINLVALALEKKRALDYLNHLNNLNHPQNYSRNHGKEPLPLCLLGGVSKFLEPYLSPELKSRLVPRKFDAAKGAIFMVKNYLKII